MSSGEVSLRTSKTLAPPAAASRAVFALKAIRPDAAPARR